MVDEKALKAARHVYDESLRSDRDKNSALRCAIIAYESARAPQVDEKVLIKEMPEASEVERVKRLEEALEKAKNQFRHYEQLHAAKPDHNKAAVNKNYADMCQQALEEKKHG